MSREHLYHYLLKVSIILDQGTELIREGNTQCLCFTQLTNHGVEDKVVNFFIWHKLPEVDRVYWSRRIDDLREIYRKRERYLNPISQQREYDLKRAKGLRKKVLPLESKINLMFKSKKLCSLVKKILTDELKNLSIPKVNRSGFSIIQISRYHLYLGYDF